MSVGGHGAQAGQGLHMPSDYCLQGPCPCWASCDEPAEAAMIPESGGVFENTISHGEGEGDRIGMFKNVTPPSRAIVAKHRVSYVFSDRGALLALLAEASVPNTRCKGGI